MKGAVLNEHFKANKFFLNFLRKSYIEDRGIFGPK